VTVRPDPALGGEPSRFQAQLTAGLQFRNEVSALHEMLNRLVSLETQIRNVQQALRDNLKGDSSSVAPVNRAARELSRKLKELKDTLYNSDEQRDAPEDDIHYLTRFADDYQGLGSSVTSGYAQLPRDAVLTEWKAKRAELDQYLARFNAILTTDVPAFNKAAQESSAPILVGGDAVVIKAAPAR
jgi:hypothetical protein